MKTAVSIPDPIFKKAEKFARKARLSRSELYATALDAYLKAHDNQSITERLNEVYATVDSRLDPVLERLQWESLPREDW
jgi:metal-responsive CopG/Arc/MetJ family transcriptional regulator